MAQTHLVKVARKFAGMCEKCFVPIDKGFSYKWISVKTPGPRSGERRIRCADCEDWHEWEYNPSIPAQCKRVGHDTEYHLRWSRYESEAGAEAVMQDTAREVDVFANTREISADRARRVFGNKNFRTVKFEQDATALRRWAKRMRTWHCPPVPEPEEMDCELCSAKKMDTELGGDEGCQECGGDGRYTPDKPGEEQLQEWRHAVADDASEILEDCPL
jgi:hypothetical protein